MKRRYSWWLVMWAALLALSLSPAGWLTGAVRADAPAQADNPSGAAVLQVIDSEPLPGEALSGQTPITLYFDHELDCATAAAAASISPEIAGEFTCEGATLTFTPAAAYARATPYTVTLADSLRGADGSQLLETYTLDLSSAGYLSVSATLPTDGSTEAVADTVLTVIFNRPVVPLGTPSDLPDLPDPLTIDPPVAGTGEWLNTAIYTFTPDTAWGGGTTYTVTVDGVTGIDGSPMQAPFSFTFTVALPQVLTTLPDHASEKNRLGSVIQVTFNQPVDQPSLEANFFLRPVGSTSSVAGAFEWNDAGTGFKFTPSEKLQMDTLYEYGYPSGVVRAAASEATLDFLATAFRTVPFPAIISTNPADGELAQPYGGFELYFASPMNPETLNDKITIDPAPAFEPDFFYRDWSDSLAVSFSTEPATAYTISIAPGMEDLYGNAITTPFTFSYTTDDYNAELALQVPSGPVGFYDAGRETTGLFITHRNVSEVDLALYEVPQNDFISRLTSDQYYNLTYDYAPRAELLLRSWYIPNVAPRNVLRYELLDLGNPAEGTTQIGTGTVQSAADCPGAMPSRASIGDLAQVLVEPDPLRARAFPPDGEIVELIYKGYSFRIVDGPICANSILWWGIELRDGQTAWVAEGLNDEYFFEITIDNQNAPVAPPPQSTIELDGGALPPGVYMLSVSAPEANTFGSNEQRHFLVVGTASLVMKTSIDSVTVWATDVRSGEPLANVPIGLYGVSDVTITETTDSQGIARFSIPRMNDVYQPLMTILDDGVHYGIGYVNWTDGIDPWRFNVNYNYYPQRYAIYAYAERGVYRPGQPVYFRGVVRQKNDMQYTQPPFDTVPVKIFDSQGNAVFDQQLPLTEFGTFSGIFNLGTDAPLGYYSLNVEILTESGNIESNGTGFDVAEYRLPEYQVKLTPEQPEVLQGETVRVTVDSTYFFGGPVIDAEVSYSVTSSGYFFDYTGRGNYSFYDFTRDEGSFSIPFDYYYNPFYGETIATGSATSDGNGQIVIEVPAELLDETRSATWTIEANVQDSTGQVVAGRTNVVVHQSEIYAGVRTEAYVGTAGDTQRANIIVVDRDSQPVAGQEVTVEVAERRWSSVQTLDNNTGRITYEYEVEEIPVVDGTVTTGADGTANFEFVPPVGGVYQITVSSRDASGNLSSASDTMWVSSADNTYVAWRVGNNSQIDLIADSSSYNVGDTAEILITSPFQGEVEALVTVERSGVLQTERLTLNSNSTTYELPITADMIPNAYVSVYLVKGVDATNPVAAFRMGLVGLSVNRESRELTIDITTDTEIAGPGSTLTYTVKTTDYQGNPVQAEVGVALTDLASLSIGQQYAGPILDAFYSLQALGVRTSSALTINTDYLTQFVLDVIKGGGGGGGGGGVFEIREEFLDTAYWNATIVTDPITGEATFEVNLPDNLTTWRLDARALTGGETGPMLVGQATFDILATKPVLVRPVTPRFMIVGDQITLAAVVNNNTSADLTTEVSLEATGVTLANDAAQTVTIPAKGSTRVEWQVSVEDVENVELIFYANANDGAYTDATRPVVGLGDDRLLPVYRYEAPETTGTGGVLRTADTRVEQIVLPRRFAVREAEITVNVSTSVAAAALESLDYLKNYPNESIEATVSRFLPNVVTYRALRDLGMADAGLETTLNQLVNVALQRLAAQQKPDGGWGWYVRDSSSPLVTAYALIGLIEAREAGFGVDNQIINRAVNYLRGQVTTRNAPGGSQGTYLRDRQIMILYALSRAGSPDNAALSNLYEQRDLLSIHSKALLALALPASDTVRINALLDDIFADAITSANGVHWEEAGRDPFGWSSNTRTNGMVLKALATYRPDSDLLPNVVRWLMVARNGDAWETTQETAWVLMGLADYMKATGELDPAYSYTVQANDETLVEADATRAEVLETQTFVLPAADTNELRFSRTAGDGALYYTAYLRTLLPVPEIEPLDRGIIVQREYRLAGSDEPISQAAVGEVIEVRLTIIAPNDLYYLVVSDPLPAGTEGIDPGLDTSQQIGTRPGLAEADPLRNGWGWWWFSNISFEDERVVLSATYLPAGTYQYVYSIRASITGTYNVIPPTAVEFYFPEVYGRGAGSAFTVVPQAE